MFRERWVPPQAGEQPVLTEPACAEARGALAQDRPTWLDPAIVEAVRDGARPGDPLPPRRPGTYFDRGTDTEVIITGRGLGRCVAVLFSYEHFPVARFGHRFPLDPFAEDREQIWLMEQIETGSVHRMMNDQPAAGEAASSGQPGGAQTPVNRMRPTRAKSR